MLIQALTEYYDILAKAGNVLPAGYSKVKVHYLVSLTGAGKIDEIIRYQDKEEFVASGGKVKERWVPRDAVMPERTEKPGIDANIIEHRPLYLFGLNLEKEGLSPDDRTGKARKSHELFVKTNLDFLEGLESPLIQAYRSFLLNWKPEEETQNPYLSGLGKDYSKSGFVFCLSGYPEKLLQEEPQIKEKWQRKYNASAEEDSQGYVAQCAVSGERATIARIHNKIKGIPGGLPTGAVLVGYNNSSENSYGKEQAYNSGISETVMKKYTEALNYLLTGRKHKLLLDDVTVVFWAMSGEETCEDLIMAMLCGSSDKLNAEQTEHMLRALLQDGRRGRITEERLKTMDILQPGVDFYMVGLKPNSSRISLKFIYKRRYADVLWNIAQFQNDLQVSDEIRPISFARIKKELVSPKSSSEAANPALLSKLFEAVLVGGKYPTALLETTVRRVRTDSDLRMNAVRAGLIKACINRNYQKGELKVALDRDNCGQAYLCGRLFAVLEKLQQDASGGTLNRTIKDAYFASASSKPVLVFPKLLKLAQTHMNKVKYPVYYSKLIGEIMNRLNGEFPESFLLADQGRFMIGYYQQYQSFFEKKEEEKKEEQ